MPWQETKPTALRCMGWCSSQATQRATGPGPTLTLDPPHGRCFTPPASFLRAVSTALQCEGDTPRSRRFAYLSCLVSLSLHAALENSRPSPLQSFLLFLPVYFSLWHSQYVCVVSSVIVLQSLAVLFLLLIAFSPRSSVWKASADTSSSSLILPLALWHQLRSPSKALLIFVTPYSVPNAPQSSPLFAPIAHLLLHAVRFFHLSPLHTNQLF